MQQRFNMMDMIERKGMPTGWSVSHSPFQLMGMLYHGQLSRRRR